MRKEKGITMVSLVIYVVVMTIALVVMSSITNSFYNNTETLKGNVKEIVEFNKFNNYFLKEIKKYNNTVDTIGTNYIKFNSGNSFEFRKDNNSIYFNTNIKVCSRVESFNIALGADSTILNVTLKLENFEKSISYKLENIY